MARDVRIAILGDASSFNRALKGAGKDAEGFGSKIAGVAKGVALAGAAVGGAAVAFAAKSASTFASVGKEVSKLQRYTGATAEEASRLRFAAKQSGIDVDSMTKSLGLLSKGLVSGKLDGLAGSMKASAKAAAGLEKAQLGLKDAQQDLNDLRAIQGSKSKRTVADGIALRKATEKVAAAQAKANELLAKGTPIVEGLGFATRDAAGKLLPMNKVLLNVAEKFKTMPNGAEKTALAMKIFGKSGADLIPFLNKGAEGLAELAKQSDRFGTTLSGKDLDAVKDATKQQRLFSSAMEGLQIQIGRYVLPIMTKFVTFLASHMPTVIEFVRKKLEEWKPLFERVGDAVGVAVTAFSRFATDALPKIQEFASMAGTAIQGWIDNNLENMKKWWDDNGPTVLTTIDTLRTGIETAFGLIIDAGKLLMEHWETARLALIPVVLFMVGRWIFLAGQASLHAVTVGLAWLSTAAAAVKATILQAAEIVLQLAEWGVLATQALLEAGTVAAAWGLTALASARATIAQGIQITMQKGLWAGLVFTAETSAARIARAWAATLGPLGIAAGAGAAINERFPNGGPKGPLNGGGWNPFKGTNFDFGFQAPWGDSGGVMPGPRGKHSLAWVAGGETLIPTHKAGVSVGSGMNVTIIMPPGSDGQDVVEKIRQYERSNGSSWRS